MSNIVSARAIPAGALFYSSSFEIPDYQRRYKWGKGQVTDFYRDLNRAKEDDEEYFLGLLITAGVDGVTEEVVDGQQRLITVTLLANCLRLLAEENGRAATAQNLRQSFLFRFDEDTELEVPRLQPQNREDSLALKTLFGMSSGDSCRSSVEGIERAHKLLERMLRDDIDGSTNPAMQIASWSKWLKDKLSFVWFQHPNAGAAYNVFMVVNTRGMDLTASELVKAYLLGIDSNKRGELSSLWDEAERQLLSYGSESDAMTLFVRHVHMLDHPYVINRYLFDDVSKYYKDSGSVERLFGKLNDCLEDYLVLLNPVEIQCDNDEYRSIAEIFRLLRVRTIRPLLLAMRQKNASGRDFERLAKAVISKWVVGGISSNTDEVLMVDAAKQIASNDMTVEAVIRELSNSFTPERTEFVRSLAERKIGMRGPARVLLSVYESESALPPLDTLAADACRISKEMKLAFDDSSFTEGSCSLLGDWVRLEEDDMEFGLSDSAEAVVERLAKRTESLTAKIAEVIYGE